MKKIFALMLVIVLAVSMAGCGNMSLGMGNYNFEKVHIDTYHYAGCLTIEQWYDNTTGIEVDTREYGPIYLSEGQYILIEKDCPFCEALEEKTVTVPNE